MDVISLFAVLVFAGSWYLRSRLGPDDPLARLFFGALMAPPGRSAGLGLLRALSARAP